MKQCSDCHEAKPADDFYRNRGRRGDGRRSTCKTCNKARVTAWRKANPERHSAHNQRYRAANPGYDYASKRTWQIDNADRVNASNRNWRERNADRVKRSQPARKLVYQAVKRGELVRGTRCEFCGKEGFCEASHTDYSRPLDVRWICRPCHRREDAQNPKTIELEIDEQRVERPR